MKFRFSRMKKVLIVISVFSIIYMFHNTTVVADNDRSATPESISDVISHLTNKKDFQTCVELSSPNGKTLEKYGTMELFERFEVTRCYDIEMRHFQTSYRYQVRPEETIRKCFVNDSKEHEHEEILSLRADYPDDGDAEPGETYIFPKIIRSQTKTLVFKEVSIVSDEFLFDLNWEEENNKLFVFNPETEEVHFIFEQITGFSLYEKSKGIIGFFIRCRW